MESDSFSLLDITWKLGLVMFLVLLNGFFVAAEFAIVKARSTRIAQLTTSQGKMAQKVIRNMDAYLSATQLGITLASLGLGWVGEPTIAAMIEPIFHYVGIPEVLLHPIAFAIAFSIMSYLHIVIGEMAPKSLAIRKAETTTLWTARPLHLFYIIFKPFIVVLNGSANWILQKFGIGLAEEHQSAHTEEEIRLIIEQSHNSGIIDQTELKLFDKVFSFTERIAREVMVPRVNIVGLDLEEPLEENLELIRSSKYTRFPVYEGDKDQIIGLLLVRDLYEKIADRQPIELRQLMRPVISIPETMEIKDVMRRFQKNKTHMAIVVDEFGGTSGLITTEDIFEEIFGEIQDEFDEEEPFFCSKEDGTSVDAKVLIEDVNRHFGLEIEDPDNDTIGGWLFSRLERIPQVGESYDLGEFRFTIESMEQLAIHRILVTQRKEESVEVEVVSTEA
ncbi:hemolysin family protein [Risungbinella massiliensis]|uniref:hemolysin family protein n=1 Tax=Risungbinella massiliensis TaxID=1329796 RepID=UPI001E5EF0CC|nr:hemolysin family protein [Risungbinella massiliensis]